MNQREEVRRVNKLEVLPHVLAFRSDHLSTNSVANSQTESSLRALTAGKPSSTLKIAWTWSTDADQIILVDVDDFFHLINMCEGNRPT